MPLAWICVHQRLTVFFVLSARFPWQTYCGGWTFVAVESRQFPLFDSVIAEFWHRFPAFAQKLRLGEQLAARFLAGHPGRIVADSSTTGYFLSALRAAGTRFDSESQPIEIAAIGPRHCNRVGRRGRQDVGRSGVGQNF